MLEVAATLRRSCANDGVKEIMVFVKEARRRRVLSNTCIGRSDSHNIGTLYVPTSGFSLSGTSVTVRIRLTNVGRKPLTFGVPCSVGSEASQLTVCLSA